MDNIEYFINKGNRIIIYIYTHTHTYTYTYIDI